MQKLTLVSLLTIVATGCGQESFVTPTASGPRIRPYRITTTCAMVTDIVQQVAGDKARVHGLMGQGVDPHLYKPTANDMRELSDADVVIYSGLYLEGRMTESFTSLARSGKPVFAVTDGLSKEQLREPPEFDGHFDPHVWMDVSLWSEATRYVAAKLADFDPENGAYYQANAAAYCEQLRELDDYARRAIATVPEPQRVLVTAHDAFGYFSRAYKIPVESVQGLSTESDAGIDDINRLVDLLVERQIKAIFVESSVPRKNIEALVQGAASKGWEVRIGGELYSDAMGEDGTFEGTYIGMVATNVRTIVSALGGDGGKFEIRNAKSQTKNGE